MQHFTPSRPLPMSRLQWLRLRAAVLSLLTVCVLALAAPSARAQTNQPLNIIPISIDSISVVNGQLLANGFIGSQPFTSPITFTSKPSADPTCPILNVRLGPINLNLLGLVVKTSPICLKVTAMSGTGNLLGNLLCDIANLLNGGTSLSTILSNLTADQISLLTSRLTDMFNNVLNLATSSTFVSGVSSTKGASCNVLNLVLGPINLNLLGLKVNVNNCSGGPVKVNITAVPGSLLGDLLCDLANLLNSGSSQADINSKLQEVALALLLLL